MALERVFWMLLVLVPAFVLAQAQDAAEFPTETGPLERTVRVIPELQFTVSDMIFNVTTMAGEIGGVGGQTAGIGSGGEGLVVNESAAEIRIELASDVLFDFDKDKIRPDASAALHKVADLLREKAVGEVRIEGHTDSKGLDNYNQRLSERRARSVKDWLVRKEGLRKLTFVAQGFGETRPVAPNSNPDGSDEPLGRQKNRRVEIVMRKSGT
jgi:outer membrane protein OmpA-like peptidoglycan-associated protein